MSKEKSLTLKDLLIKILSDNENPVHLSNIYLLVKDTKENINFTLDAKHINASIRESLETNSLSTSHGTKDIRNY